MKNHGKITVNWSVLEEKAKHRISRKKSLKDSTDFLRNANTPRKSPLALLPTIFQSLLSLFQGMHLSSGKLHTKMCDNYGHVIEGQTWSYSGIKCRDCGVTVTSPDQLRKAMPLVKQTTPSSQK